MKVIYKPLWVNAILLLGLIIVSSSVYFVIADYRASIFFCLLCICILLFSRKKINDIKIILFILLTNSIFLFGNWLFSPNSGTSLNFLIFHINIEGFKIGVEKWMNRSGTLILGYAWIMTISIAEISELVIYPFRHRYKTQKWIIAFFSFFQKERDFIVDFYKAIKVKGIGLSIFNLKFNVILLSQILIKYVSEFFDKTDKYSYAISTHYNIIDRTKIAEKIVLKNYSLKYPDAQNPALKDINLEIYQGEYIWLTGSDKAGKTSLLKALSGYIPKISGAYKGNVILSNEESFDNIPLASLSQAIRYMPQQVEDFLFGITVHQELYSINQHYIDYLKILGLEEVLPFLNREISKLSGGEKVKIALASILISQPNLLLIDAPFAQLDNASRIYFSNILKLCNQKFNTTVIIAEDISRPFYNDITRKISMRLGEIYEDIPDFHKSKMFASLQIVDLPKLKSCKNDSLLLNVENLSISINNRTLIESANLKLYGGEIIVIVGGNGTGKSTLALSIVGAEETMFGEIKKRGNIEKHAAVRYIFQNPSSQTLTENVKTELLYDINFCNNVNNYNENKVFMEISDWLNTPLDMPINQLHSSELKRLVIGSNYYNSDVIILDEPTNGIDFTNKKDFILFVNNLSLKGKGIIIITHDEELIKSASDIYRIEDNKLKKYEN